MDETNGLVHRERSHLRHVAAAIAMVVVALVVSASAWAVSTAVAAPSNTALPVISGGVQQGQTLTASPGSWSASGPIVYGYQWERCDPTGAHCGNIGGAGAATYVLAKPDVGHTLRVVVTATSAGASGLESSAATAPVTAVAAPSNTALPVISGGVQQGQTLTASPGSWSASGPIVYGYQWERCDPTGAHCGNIGGAGAATYVLAKPDVGHTLRVVVTATSAGASSLESSAATAPVTAVAAPSNTALPVISGGVQQGQTLTASPGSWSASGPIVYGYQWERCDPTGAHCGNIGGAGAATYVLAKPDVGHTLRVVVTATSAGASSSASSAATPTVTTLAPPPPPLAHTLSLSSSAFRVVYGAPVTLSGTTSIKQAGQTVTILAEGYGFPDATFAPIATVTTNGTGAFSLGTRPRVQTSYRAEWLGATSSTLTVGVNPLVSFHVIAGGRFSTHVVASRSFASRLVQLQRLSASGRWLTLERLRLNANSSSIFRPRLPNGSSKLRIAFSVNQAGAGYLGGVSRSIVYERR